MFKRPPNKKKVKGLLSDLRSNFAFSGMYQLIKDFKIFYEIEKGQAGVITMPNPNDSDIVAALKNAKISGFGKGHQNVVDQTYRKACEILPQGLGFSPIYENILYTICQDVTKILESKGNKVTAQLIKLNIYGPGGFFKTHVDSPKGNAFGSLVVFLPNAFEGGVLSIQHELEERQYSYGSKNPNKTINWVAFFNDCAHSISEVKSGYRLTLSYNLYLKEQINGTISVKADQKILEILQSLPCDKQHIYYCQHYYGNNALKNSKNPLMVLKGKDAEVWLAAQESGIKIQLKFYMGVQQRNLKAQSEEDYYKYKYFLGNPQTISEVKAGNVEHQGYDFQQRDWVLNNIVQKYGLLEIDTTIPIEFLNDQIQSSKYTYAIEGYYGNDYTLNQKYCELVLYIPNY